MSRDDRKNEREGRVEEPPELTPEDEAALDRAWDEIDRQEKEREKKEKKGNS